MRRAALSLLLTTLALTACNNNEEPRPPADGETPSAAASPADPARQLMEGLFAEDAQPAPATTVTGSLLFNEKPVPVIVDIVEVRADESSTLLRCRMRSSTGQRVSTLSSTMARPGIFDTRGIVLRDAAGKARLQPYTYEAESNDVFTGDPGCTCSTLPINVDAEGVLLYGVFPPLDPGATTVDVLMPGIAPATVPVTR